MAGFTLTGSMSVGRHLRSAVLLADGRVLAAGGRDLQGPPLLTAEVYDPQAGQWAPTGSLHRSHERGLLVATADGAALVGGDEPGQDTFLETWSSATEQWTPTIVPPFMSRVDGAWREGDQLLVLSLPEALLDDMEFRAVDLTNGQLDKLPSPITARHNSLNCQLSDGRILLTAGLSYGLGGGGGPVEFVTRECEVYDPVAGGWDPVGDLTVPHMNADRSGQSLVALPDGGALMVAGSGLGAQLHTDVVERWTSATGAWDTRKPLTQPRDAHTTTVLPGGSVLVAGGEGPSGLRSDCHTYDLESDSWSSADSLTQPRVGHIAVALTEGRVLIIDGDGSCELFA
ncbi:Kelch repeat-containing protein [Modestobacter excelsi]|uniref:Kelch repeat-containing protein n=1 Tax=Modestobacter excelsi TaxID=2213161 RepID=UPI00110D207B|nr:kelch repeat-containing protein [Modestobacter excelsi]